MSSNNFDDGGSGDGGGSWSTDDGSSSSSDGFTLPSVLKEFAANPRGFILGIVATWIVGGILLIGRTVVDSILLAFDSLLLGLESATVGLIGALDSVGAPVLEAAAGVPAFYLGLVEPFGPLAPAVAVGGVVVTIVLLIRAFKAVLLEIPLFGGLLEFLGVDL